MAEENKDAQKDQVYKDVMSDSFSEGYRTPQDLMGQKFMSADDYQYNLRKAKLQGAANASGMSIPAMDAAVQEGIMAGQGRAQTLYGQSMGETGQQVQDIIQRRQASLDGDTPAARQLRESRNRRLAMAKQGGATSGQMESVRRQSERDIADVTWSREQQALNEYQKTISNVLSGQSTLELMWGGLGASTLQQDPGTTDGGLSVICTELHRQGYLTDEEIFIETIYGGMLRMEDPSVYWGYRAWADKVVPLMKNSKTITKIVSLFAVPWVRQTKFGKLLNMVGLPLCRMIGSWRTYGKVQSA